MNVSAPLARSLAAARPALNARVAAARHARPGFDSAGFADMLRVRLDPVAAAVEAVAPDRTGAVVDAGFDILLTLAGRGQTGARSAAVERLWRDLLPLLAGPLAERPFETMGALTNGAINIAGTAGGRIGEWLDLLAKLAPTLDADTLAPVGQVAAWRAGLSQFREGALKAADALPEKVALVAFDASGSWAKVRAGFESSPWWAPDDVRVAETCENGIRFGAFTGFGGSFPFPPEPAAIAEGFVVRSRDRDTLLIADIYGTTLHAAGDTWYDEALTAPAAPSPKIAGREVTLGDRAVTVDLPAEGLVAVANGHSAAIASPFSHTLRLYPWTRP